MIKFALFVLFIKGGIKYFEVTIMIFLDNSTPTLAEDFLTNCAAFEFPFCERRWMRLVINVKLS